MTFSRRGVARTEQEDCTLGRRWNATVRRIQGFGFPTIGHGHASSRRYFPAAAKSIPLGTFAPAYAQREARDEEHGKPHVSGHRGRSHYLLLARCKGATGTTSSLPS